MNKNKTSILKKYMTSDNIFAILISTAIFSILNNNSINVWESSVIGIASGVIISFVFIVIKKKTTNKH